MKLKKRCGVSLLIKHIISGYGNCLLWRTGADGCRWRLESASSGLWKNGRHKPFAPDPERPSPKAFFIVHAFKPLPLDRSLLGNIVHAWIEIHKDELFADWELAVSGEEPFRIEPLR